MELNAADFLGECPLSVTVLSDKYQNHSMVTRAHAPRQTLPKTPPPPPMPPPSRRRSPPPTRARWRSPRLRRTSARAVRRCWRGARVRCRTMAASRTSSSPSASTQAARPAGTTTPTVRPALGQLSSNSVSHSKSFCVCVDFLRAHGRLRLEYYRDPDSRPHVSVLKPLQPFLVIFGLGRQVVRERQVVRVQRLLDFCAQHTRRREGLRRRHTGTS
jgi:hypothetical protein